MTRKVDLQLPTLLKIKVMIIGEKGVGKTCLLRRYVNGKSASMNTEPTIGIDFLAQRRDVDDKPAYIHYWDISGDEFYTEVRNEFYTETTVIVFVYDVTNKDTFTQVQAWIDEAKRHNADLVGSAIFGNQKDGPSRVTQTEAESLAKANGLAHFTVCAKSGEGLSDAFEAVIRAAAKKVET